MGLFKKTKDTGIMDEIRCDESSYLIWKWRPYNSQPGENMRENAIRWGSSLRVKEGEVAVFVYKKNDETYQDFIKGPFDKIIETKNIPLIANAIGLAYNGGTPFQAEVYFINLAQIIQVKFGVPFFDVYDPRFLDFGVPIAVRGTISFKINDYCEFIKLHRLNSFNLNDFQQQIKDAVSRYVKEVVTNAPSANNIPLVQIETKTEYINKAVEEYVTDRLKKSFGVIVSGLDIGAIEIDKSSDGYKQLMSVTKDIEVAKISAQAQDYVERMRIQREESQYAQHKQTQSANIGAFQIEKQAQIGIAGAEALGQMGNNNAGAVDLGTNTGFNPVAMMAGMAVGGAVGQNLVGTMNNAMSIQTQVPPIPNSNVVFNVVINGQSEGPYDINALTQMVANGLIKSDTLVWRPGMSNWQPANTASELQNLFGAVPPPVPHI